MVGVLVGLRTNLGDFGLANPIYAGASVAVFTVDPATQERTTTLATLYDSVIGSGTLPNPQALDGDGKWQQPIYVDSAVVMVVQSSEVEAHETGIAGIQATFRGEWETDVAYLMGDVVRDATSGDLYIAATGHVSGDWDEDVAAGLWLLYIEAATEGEFLPISGGTLTGPVEFEDDATFLDIYSRRIHLTGAHSATGTYSSDLAPFSWDITLPRVSGASAPTQNRNIMQWSFSADRILSVGSNPVGNTIRLINLSDSLGVTGLSAASSWGGSRVLLNLALVDRSPPTSLDFGPGVISSSPATNVLTLGQVMNFPRGGTAPEPGLQRGSAFNLFSGLTFNSGAVNFNVIRHIETGLSINKGASVRGIVGIGVNIDKIEGPIPTGPFVGISLGRRRRSVPGPTSGFRVGGRAGVSGVDQFLGIGFEWSASSADITPSGLVGMSIRDVRFRRNAIEWAGGDIGGGVIGAAGTGRLRLGTAFFKQSSTGLSLDVKGWEGFAPGTDITMTTGDLYTASLPGTIFEDDLGGVYRSRARTAMGVTSVQVMSSPVSETNLGSTPIEIWVRPNTQTTVTSGFNLVGTATLTTHPTPLTNEDPTAYVGMYLQYLSGAAANERKVITGYDPDTGILTTAAFTNAPSLTNDIVANGNFTVDPTTAAEGVVASGAGWSWFAEGSLTKPTWTLSAVVFGGDGIDSTGFDQQLTVVEGIDYEVAVTYQGNLTVHVGSTQGTSDLANEIITYPPVDDDDTVANRVATLRFRQNSGTTAWLRFFTNDLTPARVDRVTCLLYTDDDISGGVRARIIPPPLTLVHTWTQRKVLALQEGGGAATFGGTLGVLGDFTINTNKLAVNASTGALVSLSTLTGTAIIPSGASIPTNGFYLPATNTLGWSTNGSARLQLTTGALQPASTGGLALGGASNGFSALHLSSGGVINFAGDVTITQSSNLLTVAGGALEIESLLLTAIADGPSYDDDAAAAAGGVGLKRIYRNGNFLMVRLT